jgi:phage host-nuclease inhibitor protein Gam
MTEKTVLEVEFETVANLLQEQKEMKANLKLLDDVVVTKKEELAILANLEKDQLIESWGKKSITVRNDSSSLGAKNPKVLGDYKLGWRKKPISVKVTDEKFAVEALQNLGLDGLLEVKINKVKVRKEKNLPVIQGIEFEGGHDEFFIG